MMVPMTDKIPNRHVKLKTRGKRIGSTMDIDIVFDLDDRNGGNKGFLEGCSPDWRDAGWRRFETPETGVRKEHQTADRKYPAGSRREAAS